MTPVVLLAALSLLGGRRDVRLGAPAAEIPVGRVQPIAGSVRLHASGHWKNTDELSPLRTGDRLLTDPVSAAQIDLAWAMLLLGPQSSLTVQPSRLLTVVLEEGRLEQWAVGHDIVRFRTSETSVRGHGHVVLRRQGQTTAISALTGAFRVDGPSGYVVLSGGQGTVVNGTDPPAPAPLPASPLATATGPDAAYVLKTVPFRLSWNSAAPLHHLQLIAVPSGDVFFAGDVMGSSHEASLPVGLFRWRVLAVSDAGLESEPSSEGLICVVER